MDPGSSYFSDFDLREVVVSGLGDNDFHFSVLDIVPRDGITKLSQSHLPLGRIDVDGSGQFCDVIRSILSSVILQGAIGG